MRKHLAVATLLLGVSQLLGCGSNTSSTNTVTVTVKPAGTIYMDAGQSVAFTAAVTGDSTNAGVNWQLLDASGGSLAQVTTTSATYVAAAKLTTPYIPLVAAISKAAPTISGSAAINVYPALAATTPTLADGRVASTYSYQFLSTGGVAPAAWTVASGTIPAGLTLTSAGLLSGTPTTAGTYTFSVSVKDSATTPETLTLFETINVSAANLAITTVSLPNALQNQPYSATLNSQYGTGAITWTLATGSALPKGLTLSTAGVISGSPTDVGPVTFSVQAVDSSATPLKATATFTITVVGPLAITTTALSDGSVKNAYSQQLVTSGGQAPITWALTSGTLPSGLTLSSTGLLSGTPAVTAVGAFTIKVTATDSFNPVQTATASYTFNIVLSTLAITTTSCAPSGTTGLAYSTTLTSSGGNAPITWSLATGSALPPPLTLSTAGVISGTPNVVGTYNFTVQATDTTPATVSQACTIKVVAPSTLKITTTTLPNGNIGTAYSATLAASLGTPAYTWALYSGTLPNGITLSSAGVLSGTTYVGGTYTFTVAVTDSTGASVTQALTLTVGTALSGDTANGLLTGSYAFLINGHKGGATAGDGKAYGFAAIGSMTSDGAGTITTGVEDTNASTGAQTAQALTGTYQLNTDGRGLLSLTAGSTTTVYAIAVSNKVGTVAQSVALTEFDNSTGSGNQSNGFAALQTASTFLPATVKGPFVFGLAGESVCSTCGTTIKYGPIVSAGLFTGDGVSAIVSGGEDISTYGGTTNNYSGLTMTGTFTTPSTTTGRGTLKFTYTGTQFATAPVNYTYILVNANEMLMMSNDSHATSALLAGDVRLQTTTSYTAATVFTGASVGYESQPGGGDGATNFPTTLNAILTGLNNTASGAATAIVDTNKAGTLTTAASRGYTYTTSASGRTYIVYQGNAIQTFYPYSVGSGFAIDLSTTTTYPALLHYEQEIPGSGAQEALTSGTLAASTVFPPVTAALTSGISTWSFFSGGVNGLVAGKISSVLDSSTPTGSLSGGQTSSLTYLEDLTGRLTIADSTNTTVAYGYAINSGRAVSMPSSTSTTPTVTVYQK